jgi:hypothetical protein
VAPCDPQVCLDEGVWSTTASGAGRHQGVGILDQQRTCAEGEGCLKAIAASPFGGWVESGTWADPETGAASTCLQGEAEDACRNVTLRAPSLCVDTFATDIAVRPGKGQGT